MKFRILILCLLLWAPALFAQNYLDVLRPFQGMSGRSGAESGVAPAAMSTSNALLGNPALLSYSEDAFVAADLSFDQVQGSSIFNSTIWETTSNGDISLNSLTYINPVHVYRGAWVWGFNLQPVHSFGRINQFGDFDPDQNFYYQYTQQETGSLYAFSAGTSIMASMHTSVGFAISYLAGENSYSKVYEETDPQDSYTFDRFVDSLHFAPQYRGFGARLGVLSALSEDLNLGLSVEFPSRISVTESAGRDSIEWFDNGLKEIIAHENWTALEYAVWGPWRLGVGLGFTSSPLEASVNYKFHSYRTSSLSGNLTAPNGGGSLEALIDQQINDNVRNVHEFSASLLWSMAPLNLSFGAALMKNPLNYRIENNLRLDVGVGYQLTSGLGFTVALRNEQWQSDLNHTLDSGVLRSVAIDNNFSKFQFGIKYIL